MLVEAQNNMANVSAVSALDFFGGNSRYITIETKKNIFEKCYVITNLDYMQIIQDDLKSVMVANRYSETEALKLQTCIEEMYINAFVHGNKMDEAKKISIELRIDEDMVEIFVEDEGEGFDPKDVPDPTSEERIKSLIASGDLEALAHGRGLWLCSKYAKLTYNEKGNRVRIFYGLE